MKWVLLLCLLAAPMFAAVPAANTAKKLLVYGDYRSDDGGHPSAMGGIFGVRAPANWTYYYSGHDLVHDGTLCMEWTNSLDNSATPFDNVLIARAIASNITQIIIYKPFGVWMDASPTNASGDYNDGIDLVILNAIRMAEENGINVFLPHYANAPAQADYAPFKSPGSPIAVGGGYPTDVNNQNTFGPQLEFIDSKQQGDIAESWANQACAARFAHVLNAHPTYNNYDARAYCHQAGTSTTWSTNIGYGFVQVTNRGNDPVVTAATVTTLDPQPPLEIFGVRTNLNIRLFWRNFYQTGWQSTVVKMNGNTIYDGPGSNILWCSTFTVFSTPYPFNNVGNGIEVPYPYAPSTFTFYSKVGGVLSADAAYSQISTGGLGTALSGRITVSGKVGIGQ